MDFIDGHYVDPHEQSRGTDRIRAIDNDEEAPQDMITLSEHRRSGARRINSDPTWVVRIQRIDRHRRELEINVKQLWLAKSIGEKHLEDGEAIIAIWKKNAVDVFDELGWLTPPR